MDAIKAIKTRRSVRMYTDEAVSEEALNTILDCGRWAPSAGNRQPWRFIVIRSSEVKKRLSRLFPQGAFMEDAPLAIAVIIDPGFQPPRGGRGGGHSKYASGGPRFGAGGVLGRQL